MKLNIIPLVNENDVMSDPATTDSDLKGTISLKDIREYAIGNRQYIYLPKFITYTYIHMCIYVERDRDRERERERSTYIHI